MEIINRKTKRFVRRKNTEKHFKQLIQSRIQKSDSSVGIIGSGVGGYKIYGGRLNQYGYRDISENLLIPSRDLFQADQNWLFQKDNAPCHTAHSITDFSVESNIRLMPCKIT